jgi:outer membrane immunogenic protein
MRKIAIGFAAIAALIGTPALAADLGRPVYKAPPPAPPAPVYSWTGWYVGANIGGHWGTDKITTTTDTGGGFGPAGAAAIDATSPTTLKPQGVIGGVQAGYNWQINTWLFGIEGDADWLGGSASRTIPPGVIPVINSGDFMIDSVKATFLATVRPRVGVVFDHLLLYATGGLAVETIKTTDTFGHFGGTIVTTTSNTTTRAGWTVGGGLEYAFANNWSAKLEYLFVDMGSFDAAIPGTAAGFPDVITVHHKYTDNIFRGGLNYQFH